MNAGAVAIIAEVQAIRERTPLWSKSQLKNFEPAGTPAPESETRRPAKPGRSVPTIAARDCGRAREPLDAETLAKLGLAQLAALPSDPRVLGEALLADDRVDASVDSDEFSRGIRRAVRLELAFRAKLHERAGQTWKAWIGEHFPAGYPSYRRYRVAAELQVGLVRRGLPLLVSNYQSRALAPLRRHARFWEILAGGFLKEGFPEQAALRSGLERALGVQTLRRSTARIRLHRRLRRAVATVPAADADPAVGQALALVGRAIAVLEQGGAS